MAIGTPVDLGGNTGSAGTTLVLTTTATAAVGDVIVVLCGQIATAFPSTCIDSAGNTYVLDNSILLAAVYRAVVTTQLGSGGTITITKIIGISTSMVAWAVSGLDTVSPLDQVHASSGASSTPSDSQTTTNANDIVFGLLFNSGTAVISVEATGFTSLTGQLLSNANLDGAYRIESATGTFTYNPTLDGAANWSDMTVSYKAAAVVTPTLFAQSIM